MLLLYLHNIYYAFTRRVPTICMKKNNGKQLNNFVIILCYYNNFVY